MDYKDFKIIRMLEMNARIPWTKIAKTLGITETAVRKRIKKLEGNNVILGYKTVINYRKIGMVFSYTGIDVEPDGLLIVLNKLKSFNQIKEMYISSGDHDIIVKIVCKDMSELEEVHRRISNIDGVKRICPAIITEPIKIK
ncbi:MAG: Lrp/AsnC family transcriptional regulator [Thermoproteales archaeon]|nr:Lrp/AsnC family transcriptional regulator [Thermoproteales archaeon]